MCGDPSSSCEETGNGKPTNKQKIRNHWNIKTMRISFQLHIQRQQEMKQGKRYLHVRVETRCRNDTTHLTWSDLNDTNTCHSCHFVLDGDVIWTPRFYVYHTNMYHSGYFVLDGRVISAPRSYACDTSTCHFGHFMLDDRVILAPHFYLWCHASQQPLNLVRWASRTQGHSVFGFLGLGCGCSCGFNLNYTIYCI